MSDTLLEALGSPPPKDVRKHCYFNDWYQLQSPERQRAIDSAMKNSKWKATDLYRLFQGQGYEKQYNTLRAHRSGTCSCDD